jgi:hypothetical protein
MAVWFGTPLIFYMYVAPPFSHACSAFAVALFVTMWLRVRDTWSIEGAVALGLAGALMAMVREQDLFFALGPAFDLGLALARGEKEKGKRKKANTMLAAVAGSAGFAIGYLPQLLAYKALNGKFSPSPLVTRKMNWSAPHAFQVLFDPQHGFFFWTPLAVLAVIGLFLLLAARTHVVGACMLLMAALQVYISGAVESWTVAGAFGQRRFVALTILLVVGLAAVRASVTGRAATLMTNTAVALCVWWNVALMAEFGTSMMDRQRLELRKNAYDAFVTLPRAAPDLVYRYFTQRASFYKPPAATEPR